MRVTFWISRHVVLGLALLMFASSAYGQWSYSGSSNLYNSLFGSVAVGTADFTDPNSREIILKLSAASHSAYHALPGLIFQAKNDYSNTTWELMLGANYNATRFHIRDGVNTRLVIDEQGKVGIGTMSPGKMLEVNGVIKCSGIEFPSGTQSSPYTGGSGGSGQWSLNSGGDIYNSNNGKVGIGTPGPSDQLEVVGSTRLGSYLKLRDFDGNSWNGNTLGATLISRDYTTMFWNGGVVIGQFSDNMVPKPYNATGALLATGPTALAVNSNSCVDIGITDKTLGKLTVVSNTGNIAWFAGSNNAMVIVDGTDEAEFVGRDVTNTNYKSISFRTGPNPGQLYLDNSHGRVGIGTTQPGQMLDVDGAIAISGTSVIDAGRNITAAGGTFSGNLTIAGSNGLTLSSGPIYLTNNTAIWMKNISGASSAVLFADGSNNINIGDYSNVLTGNIIFRTAGQPKMFILANGCVGIGKAPSQQLDVAGAIAISGTSVIDTGRNIVNAGNGAFNGSVIIGNRTTTSYKLDIVGNVRANEVVVNTDGSDFVFEEGYKLMDLTRLADYIKQNKHLPDIAPADDMRKGGVGVGDMQTKLLQKIEELTLYVIAQDKKIEEQNRRILRLEKENEDLRSRSD